MEKGQFEKLLGDIYAHGCVMLSLSLGHELGIVKFLCDAEEPVSVEEVSTKLNLKERYILYVNFVREHNISSLNNIPVKSHGFAVSLVILAMKSRSHADYVISHAFQLKQNL